MMGRCNSLAEDIKERINLQDKLIKKYNMPLVSISFNCLTELKMNNTIFDIVQTIGGIVSDMFSPYIYFILSRETSEGYNSIFIINRNALEIKKIALQIEENHLLGKCINIDVFNKDTKKISRIDIGKLKRRCYLCNGDAEKCIKNKKHSQKDMVKYAYDKYKQYAYECMRNRNLIK
ncbi:citX protein [Clostridium novyi A str. GD211209]|nr:citX protein [Clostridium novyi A str. GD211209]